MKKTEDGFIQVVSVLPVRLRQSVLLLPEEIRCQCEELRLRAGQALHYSITGQETVVEGTEVTIQDLQETLSRATRYSVHSFSDMIRQGFVTLEGGHRIGLCGTAVLQNGELSTIRELSSLNLRIAGQQLGAADTVLPEIYDGKQMHSTLIISPPAFGKTTLLRDCIRQLSECGVRVGVADERFEIAGMVQGKASFSLGPTTDSISGAPKAQAAMQLVRTMSPQVLAVDEVTSPEDVTAICYAAHCGVSLLATVHAIDLEDFQRRTISRALLEDGFFTRIIEIHIEDGIRQYRIQKGKENTIC